MPARGYTLPLRHGTSHCPCLTSPHAACAWQSQTSPLRCRTQPSRHAATLCIAQAKLCLALALPHVADAMPDRALPPRDATLPCHRVTVPCTCPASATRYLRITVLHRCL